MIFLNIAKAQISHGMSTIKLMFMNEIKSLAVSISISLGPRHSIYIFLELELLSD